MMLRFCVVLAASAAIAAAADVRVVEEIVAKVNGDIITKSEIERTRHAIEAELHQRGVNGAQFQKEAQEREKDALRDQIDQLLLVQKGKDLNINVDPDVTRRLAEIQVQSKIADPDKFHAWLREQSGMSYEDFRQQMKNQLLTQRVIGQEISSRIAIPDNEKRKYYEDHKKDFVRQEEVYLRQILVSTEKRSPEQAEKRAKDLVARARKGEKFGEMARDNSDDVETARNMGELPPFKRGELRKEIEDIVFTHDKGYVTDPIKVPNGFLILRIEERYQAGQATYEEVENEITERLAMPQVQPKVRDYLTRLRDEAFLQIRDGYVDTGAAPGKDTAWTDPAQLKPETTTKAEVLAQKKRRFLWIFPRGGGEKHGEGDKDKGKIESPQPAAESKEPAQPAGK